MAEINADVLNRLLESFFTASNIYTERPEARQERFDRLFINATAVVTMPIGGHQSTEPVLVGIYTRRVYAQGVYIAILKPDMIEHLIAARDAGLIPYIYISID